MESFLCAWCGSRFEFSADRHSREHALHLATKHVEDCEQSPLVKRIKDLEKKRQLPTLKGLSSDMSISTAPPTVLDILAPESLRVQELEEGLRVIKLECRKRLALAKKMTDMVGFSNIDTMVDKLLNKE